MSAPDPGPGLAPGAGLALEPDVAGHVVLVLGGVRSGKSEVAEALVTDLAKGAAVTYVATGRRDLADVGFAARIASHRHRRPQHWVTVEAGDDLAVVVAASSGPVLVDSLTTWVSAHATFQPAVDSLVDALRAHVGAVVVVSDEVGLGGYPATDMGGRFADALGSVNQAVARIADRVLLVVAGRVMELPSR